MWEPKPIKINVPSSFSAWNWSECISACFTCWVMDCYPPRPPTFCLPWSFNRISPKTSPIIKSEMCHKQWIRNLLVVGVLCFTLIWPLNLGKYSWRYSTCKQERHSWPSELPIRSEWKAIILRLPSWPDLRTLTGITPGVCHSVTLAFLSRK